MESKEKKTESRKKAANKSSSSKKDQKSKKDKEANIDQLSEKIIEQNENIQKQMEMFEEIFYKQNQLIEKQNQISNDLMRTLENVLQKSADTAREQTGKEVNRSANVNKDFVLFRNAYRNLAQRNVGRDNDIKIDVTVTDIYNKNLKKLEQEKNLTHQNN